MVVKSVFQTAAFAGFPNVSFMVGPLPKTHNNLRARAASSPGGLMGYILVRASEPAIEHGPRPAHSPEAGTKGRLRGP